MRLIDADELRAYWEECKSMFKEGDPKRKQFDDAIWDLDHSETLDAVQVVRCKECCFYGTSELEVCVFYDAQWANDDDDFCPFGERREECTKVQFN